MTHPSKITWLRPKTLGIVSFVGVLFVAVSAWADAGVTELFVRNTASVLRTLHGSLQGTAIQHGYTDIELHFGVSILMGAIGFQLAVVLLNQERARLNALIMGFIMGMTPGVAKELIDMASPPDYFSWHDIIFDTAGVITGIVLVWVLIHVLAKRRHAPVL